MSAGKEKRTMNRQIPLALVGIATFSLFAVPARAQTASESPPVAAEPPAVTPEPAPVTPEPAPVAAEPTADPSEANLQAGSHGGLFYLKDKNDNFRLYVQGRAHIDTYNYFGPGVADSALKSTIFLRRARAELSGEFLKGLWQWQLSGDWGNGSPSTAAGQTVAVKGAPTDVYLNFHPDGLFNVQVGQYDAPFMMENRTSDKFIPFMERSLAVRALGIPTNKEAGVMVWGETKDKLAFYSLGIFDGDGQNKPNLDNRADFMSRVFFHPLAPSGGLMKELQIGASARYGVRDTQYINYDYPGMTTQGNYTFFGSTYTSSKGLTHIIPSGKQTAFAGELRIPVDMIEFSGEFVYISNETREAIDGFQAAAPAATPSTPYSERFGSMKGYAYYAQLAFWPMGGREIIGNPGYENPAHVDLKKADKSPTTALQVLLKWEQLNVKYDSASRAGTADANNVDGSIKVNALSLGVNYWATKHVRLTANYVMNMFPSSAPASATAAGGPTWNADQRARAPGNTLPKLLNDDARDNAHVLHELLLRCAVAF
jgi:phosphate-selective porin